jgi:ferredoxin-NADP reductase
MTQAAGNPSQAPAAALRAHLAGLADRFAWPLRTSHYLELVNPLWTTHALHARVEEVWEEARGVRTLRIRPGRGWRGHRAGQHVRLGVSIAGMQHTRTYTIASAPERGDGCIAITVKAVPEGRVSRHLVQETRPGAHLRLGLPQGDFVLPEALPVLALFISAGSGITPFMSMLRSLASRGAHADIVHLHYAPTAQDVIFGDELAALAKSDPGYRLHRVHTREPGGDGSATGHFSGAQLRRLCPDWSHRDAYACGPQGLLAALQAHCSEAGRRLRVERFRAALAETPADAAGGRVRFIRSSVEIEADGRTSLLRVAEAAGLAPPHGCRMGICHSCTVTLRAGCVRDLRNNVLTDEPGTRVQICVCAAAGDVELEA